MPHKYSHSNVVSDMSSAGLISGSNIAAPTNQPGSVSMNNHAVDVQSQSVSASQNLQRDRRRFSASDMKAPMTAEERASRRKSLHGGSAQAHNTMRRQSPTSVIDADLARSYQRAASKRALAFVKSQPEESDHEGTGYFVQLGSRLHKSKMSEPLRFDLTKDSSNSSQSSSSPQESATNSSTNSRTSTGRSSNESSDLARDSISKDSSHSRTKSYSNSSDTSGSTKPTPLSVLEEPQLDLHALEQDEGPDRRSSEARHRNSRTSQESTTSTEGIQAKINRLKREKMEKLNDLGVDAEPASERIQAKLNKLKQNIQMEASSGTSKNIAASERVHEKTGHLSQETQQDTKESNQSTVPTSSRIQSKADRLKLRALSPVVESPARSRETWKDLNVTDAEVSRILRNSKPSRDLPDPPDIGRENGLEVVEDVKMSSNNTDGTKIAEQEAEEVNNLSEEETAPNVVLRRQASPPPAAGYEETRHIEPRAAEHNEPEAPVSNQIVGEGHLPETAVMAPQKQSPNPIAEPMGQPHIEAVRSDGTTQRISSSINDESPHGDKRNRFKCWP
ncbi:MAG: hypothetical protein Q9227_005129 [Pyrenula ochraceoflavens]